MNYRQQAYSQFMRQVSRAGDRLSTENYSNLLNGLTRLEGLQDNFANQGPAQERLQYYGVKTLRKLRK